MRRQVIVVVLSTLAVCLALDWATFSPSLAPLGITPWNPSNGLCVAVVLRAGLVYAPLLGLAPLLSSFIVRALPFPWHILVAEAVLVGFCYTVAVWVLTRSRWRIDAGLNSIRDLITMCAATSIAALVVAVVYNLILFASGLLAADDLLPAVFRYGIGDVIGILVMMPFVLLVSIRHPVPRLTLEHLQQLLAILLAVAVVFGVAVEARMPVSYLLFLPIVWIAVRGGLGGVSAGLMIMQIGIMTALHFAGGLQANVTAFQALMVALAISGLIIGVLIDERGRHERHLRLQQDAIARAARVGALGEVTTALAHELNQPLTAAGNYGRAILGAVSADPPDLAGARSAIRKALDQIDRGAQIVVRLRDYIRVGRLEIGAHDLADLLEECVALMRPELERSGTRIDTLLPRALPALAIDPLQIQQVMINLLRNSIEAIEAAGPAEPRISVTARPLAHGLVEVTIADNGVGFPPGFRLSSAHPVESTKVDGLGIGLSLCRSILESHGGELSIVPAASGAAVSFTLPVAGRTHDVG